MNCRKIDCIYTSTDSYTTSTFEFNGVYVKFPQLRTIERKFRKVPRNKLDLVTCLLFTSYSQYDTSMELFKNTK